MQPEPPSSPERIDLTQAEDPRDIVHRTVACLAQGGVVALPTDTSYGLAASALHPEAVERLRTIKQQAGHEGPLPLAIKGADEAPDWVPDLTLLGQRLARRAWPGPVTLIVRGDIQRGLARRLAPEVRAVVAPGETIGLRSSGHPVLRDVLQLMPGPLVLTGARSRSVDGFIDDPALDMILDTGPMPAEAGPTVVFVDGSVWNVARPGAVSADDLSQMAATVLLFVCTGNTCRSPMAEALCKALLAQRLGCPPEDVPNRGFVVLSAGVGAMEGMPAASHAIDVVRARGGSLIEHCSRRVSRELIRQSDLIIAMTRDHRDALLAHLPEAADRVRLLHPGGGDIDDPIGADRETYHRTADMISEHLRHLLDDLGV